MSRLSVCIAAASPDHAWCGKPLDQAISDQAISDQTRRLDPDPAGL